MAADQRGGLIFALRRYTVWSVKSTPLVILSRRSVIDQSADKTAKGDTRRRILDAAQELSRCSGTVHLSLDAVAAKAGVSKGGLLYHFPSKALLMEALVEDFLGRYDAALSAEERTGQPDSAIRAYLSQFRAERDRGKPASSGLLAALAEDPDMLAPVRRREADFLARIRATASDPELATLAFLAIHGIRAMELLNIKVLERADEDALLDTLAERLTG